MLCVLLLCVCLYIPAWVACRRADAIAKENRKIHHLSDNSPHDRHLYAVSVRTGPRSALRMSAKVKLRQRLRTFGVVFTLTTARNEYLSLRRTDVLVEASNWSDPTWTLCMRQRTKLTLLCFSYNDDIVSDF